MQTVSPFYQFAHDFALFTNRSVFLTGKAGTGKTTFLHNLREETRKQMAIVAPTGVAAINAGGTTIHSFFQLPFTPYIPTHEGRKNLLDKIKMQGSRRKVLQELELLVIDEISMVRADVVDAIDTILRHVRYRNSEPFGGVQVIFIGDMFQLSPVAVEDEWRLLSQYYTSPYFFHSKAIIEQPPVYIELDKIFRQNNPEFISVLNEVRNNKLSNEGLKLLQAQYNPSFKPPDEETWITLTTHNYKADQINSGELAKIKTPVISFEAKIEGDYPEKSYPTEKTLTLKVGARVMFLKNDTETPRRYYNGKIGVIEELDDDSISIFCPDDQQTIELKKTAWENIRYSTNPETKQIKEEELGKFIQFPLRLAWAITIHKSQGLTFDKAIIDAGSAFAPGQVYVALSRCRTLSGMILLSSINPQSIQNDRQIVEYESNKLNAADLNRMLDESRSHYRNFILNQLFDFRNIAGPALQLVKDTGEHASSFNDETMPFLNTVHELCSQLQTVAEKFNQQLTSILWQSPVNEDYLSERLAAASAYFKERCSILMETLRLSPARTDSRTHASDYTDGIATIFSNTALKSHLFSQLKGYFGIEDYFLCKNTFKMPEFQIPTYAKTSSSVKLNSRNPELFRKLMALRNKLCEPQNLPIYLVAGTQTLLEMSDYLPLTAKDLLQISGFGPAKTEKYGQQFLDEIQQFCSERGLDSCMHEKSASKKSKEKETKTKKPIGETFKTTLEMYKSGKTIEEIAFSRNLAQSTIIGHLERYVKTGELDINDFVSKEKRERALTLLPTDNEGGSLFEMLGTFMNYNEVKMFMAWYRTGNQ